MNSSWHSQSTLEQSGSPFGLYLHIPFCRSRCPYCHFVSEIGQDHLITQYIKAVTDELHARVSGSPKTIYIGGGTPSLIDPGRLNQFLTSLPQTDIAEITIEANPESVRTEWLDAARSAGCTRISIGVQSFDDDELSRLGRIHSSQQSISAVELARARGFDNISIDLMYSIPGQTVASFHKTLETVVRLAPEHVSSYALSIEQDTAFADRYATTHDRLPSDEKTATMYRMLHEVLDIHGYEWYELSNFARPGYACRHNLAYWDFTPYIGIGVGAHSYDGIERSWNVRTIEDYLSRMEKRESATAGTETITKEILRSEQIMFSLRTRHGLGADELASFPDPECTCLQRVLDRYTSFDMLQLSPEQNYVLTVDGALLADEIIADLLTCLP